MKKSTLLGLGLAGIVAGAVEAQPMPWSFRAARLWEKEVSRESGTREYVPIRESRGDGSCALIGYRDSSGKFYTTSEIEANGRSELDHIPSLGGYKGIVVSDELKIEQKTRDKWYFHWSGAEDYVEDRNAKISFTQINYHIDVDIGGGGIRQLRINFPEITDLHSERVGSGSKITGRTFYSTTPLDQNQLTQIDSMKFLDGIIARGDTIYLTLGENGKNEGYKLTSWVKSQRLGEQRMVSELISFPYEIIDREEIEHRHVNGELIDSSGKVVGSYDSED